jgi:hypothetical protein
VELTVVEAEAVQDRLYQQKQQHKMEALVEQEALQEQPELAQHQYQQLLQAVVVRVEAAEAVVV